MTPETHTERVGLAAWYVMQGPISSCALATLLAMPTDRAMRLMLALSRVLPIRYDRAKRMWRLCEGDALRSCEAEGRLEFGDAGGSVEE